MLCDLGRKDPQRIVVLQSVRRKKGVRFRRLDIGPLGYLLVTDEEFGVAAIQCFGRVPFAMDAVEFSSVPMSFDINVALIFFDPPFKSFALSIFVKDRFCQID